MFVVASTNVKIGSCLKPNDGIMEGIIIPTNYQNSSLEVLIIVDKDFAQKKNHKLIYPGLGFRQKIEPEKVNEDIYYVFPQSKCEMPAIIALTAEEDEPAEYVDPTKNSELRATVISKTELREIIKNTNEAVK